jgi:hypothetical protein
MATTSKRAMISAIAAAPSKSRLGLCSSPDRHRSERLPKRRMFQVAIRRLRSKVFAGMA